jgi:hypothetical protein
MALLLASPASAQTGTISPAPEGVAVTIYRSPDRGAATPINLQWLSGYALISETRRIDIPAGEAEIRFEGVAGGIIPESAIVTGLPEGVAEKNQDAWLLSPASLLERSLGRRVLLRRTSSASGETKEQEAIIRSGPGGAVVLQTPQGVEALRCTGLNETIVYPSVPLGLSAKPTLSVRTSSTRAASATVTLSYLATGFDWQANYVATLAPTEDRMELFAWVTLANGDETGFANASTQTVAGRVKREHYEPGVRPRREALNLSCWPEETTSDIETRAIFGVPPPPPPPPLALLGAPTSESIVVTGSRITRKALQEELGDLKLYRIPDPVTVAANSQKQVAMLEKDKVAVEMIYRQEISAGSSQMGILAPTRVLVSRNRTAEGLGLPLPAGRLVLFGAGARRPILLGEGYIEDRAVGEDVEVELGPATGIYSQSVPNPAGGGGMQLVVTNDRGVPAIFEAEFDETDARISTKAKLSRRNGRPVWRVIVPPNGTATLPYLSFR